MGRFLADVFRPGKRSLAPDPSTARDDLPPARIEIPECTPLQGRRCPDSRPRFNLLIPSLLPEHVFGGIATALQFFDRLVGADVDARIVLTDRSDMPGILPVLLSGWVCADADREDASGRIVVPFGNRAGRTLPVRCNDIFVATGWWTAYVVQRLIAWQSRTYRAAAQPLIYLIQDHEPGFYPLSSRYLMARSTYEYAGPAIGVFNTALLKDYFAASGYRFSHVFAFEPHLNPVLARYRAEKTVLTKERRLILYGRPGVPRNAFELLCQGVRYWSEIDPMANNWRIESLGEEHREIALHNGAHIVSRGKLSLEDYGDTLSRAAMGVSLMLSPHPSYPPLEMAEFGVQTVTNRFANKNLGALSPFVRSLESVTPESIGALLAQLAMPFRDARTIDVRLPPTSLFSTREEAFPFMPALRDLLEATTA